MENYYNHSNGSYNDDSNTYVSGSGFINNQPEKMEIKQIKKASNTMSLAVLIKFLIASIISGPMLFFLTVTGIGGYFTGTSFIPTEEAELFIDFLSLCISTIIVFIGLPIFLKNSKEVKNLFGMPKMPILLCAVSFILAISVMETHMLETLQENFDLLGITVGLPSFDIGSSSVSIALTFFFTVFCIPIVEEILYRGVMLNFMRKHSDTFAVVFCSFLPAILQESLAGAVSTFIFSLVLCYFTIKSQSVITAIVMRVCASLFVYLKAFAQLFFVSKTASILIILLEIAILICAIFALMIYSHKNSRSFCTRSKTVYYNDISKLKFAVKSPLTLLITVIFVIEVIF